MSFIELSSQCGTTRQLFYKFQITLKLISSQLSPFYNEADLECHATPFTVKRICILMTIKLKKWNVDTKTTMAISEKQKGMGFLKPGTKLKM